MKPFLALFFFITSLCAEVMVDDYLNGPTTPTQNLRSQKGIMPKICDLNSSAALGEDIARGAMSAGIGAVSAEVIAEAYVGDRQLTEADRDFIERGVLLSQIGAIISASLLDLDVDTAATFGGIAARENTFNLKGPEIVPLTEEGITALRESLAQMQVENPALAKKIIAVQRIFNRYLSGEVSREKLAKGAVLLCVQLNDYMAKHPEGTAAMTTTLEYAGMLLNFAFKAQITLAAGPVGLAAACAVDQAVEAAVDTGLEALAKEAASLGKTKAQQERFYQAVRNVVGTGLLLVGASKMKGAVKGLKKPKDLGNKAFDKNNKAPYDPHAMEAMLKEGHGADAVKAHTIAPKSAPNAKLGKSGQPHPETGVPFDQRGFPNFEKHVIFETRIPDGVAKSKLREVHMKAATQDLKIQIEKGSVDVRKFNQAQLNAIMDGNSKIPDLTWHHHQETGRMHLIPEDLHTSTAHAGGFKSWK